MNKKKVILGLIITTLLTISGSKTYAYYISRTNIEVSSQSSKVICDAEIQEVPSSEKNIFGYSEFKVVVKNYDNSNNVSNEPFDYILTIENNNSSNGLFGYNNQFNSQVEINDSLSNDTQSQKNYSILVKSNDGLASDINYKVKLNCIQSN